MKHTLVVLLGPTGVGKTELSLQLAGLLHSPVLNADSRQMYRDIPIGTAAPAQEVLSKVRHYFVGTLALEDYYSAARFESESLQLLDSLFKTHEAVLMSGGSMMYIDAVCKGIDDIPTVDADMRHMMMEKYEKEGLERLQAELKVLDPQYAKIVDLKNPRRVIHALEICYMTGKTYTSFRTRAAKKRPFNILKIGLQRDREELYARINQRVDDMMADGLIREAESVYPFRNLNSLNTVGFKELFNYFDGVWPLDLAVEKIKRSTRIYSRKQMTWFKHDNDIHWFHPDDKPGIIRLLQERNLINP